VVISEQSFPLSVVQVKSSVKLNAEDDGTDGSGNGNEKVAMSSITCSRYSSSNSNDSSNHNNSLDEDTPTNNKSNISKKENGSSASDDSSSDSKNLRKASEALNRNVQLHNAKLCKEKENNHRNRQQHTDDVTGATVTANNADARLSSLQHRPAQQLNVTKNSGEKTKASDSKLTFENLEAQSNSSGSSNSLLEGVEENNRRSRSSSKRLNNKETSNGNSSDDSGYGEGSDSFPSREDSSSSDNEDENSSEARSFLFYLKID